MCGIGLLFCAPDTGDSIQNFVVGLVGNCAVVSHTIMHIGDEFTSCDHIFALLLGCVSFVVEG